MRFAFRTALPAACLAILATACSPETSAPVGPAAPPMPAAFAWDTAFQVRGVPVTSDSVVARSRAHPGDGRRLQAFFRKCVPGARMRVGFLGGSITEGAHALAPGGRYASRLCAFLGRAFPGTEFVEVNAGIGATTSRFGASRVREDLLDHGPDLVVLEYAVNDDISDTAASEAAMEGLIRRCLRTPDLPVVLFQTVNVLGDSLNHRVQLRLARHYGLPVVSYRAAVWPLVAAGELPWASLSPDEVHPNDEGHLIGGYLLYSFLKSAHSAPGVLGRGGAGLGGAVAPPLATDLFESADLFRPGDTALAILENRGWSVVEDARGRYNLVSGRKGDRLALRCDVRELTLSYLHRKDLDARVSVTVDGAPLDTLSNHFPQDWGGGYLKPRRVFLDSTLGHRTVELVNASGGLFDLRYLLYAP